ncbi:MAG: hypothetical protein J5449_12065 [Oscillospiraceae bacterium]|nr:hypothetical protein [Oscillospiraceae bacterium]
MELQKIYGEVLARLGLIDFSSLWRGFAPLRFALYNDEQCFFDGAYIEKTEEFTANTSIEYKGEHIAIWDLSEPVEDLDLLASSIVHEMFHAFQKASGESRWADERAALFDYRYSTENITMKLDEAELIKDAFANGSAAAFSELLSLRKLRSEKFPAEYDYEARIEQIEGSANYVELKALAQLDPQKAASAWDKIMDKIKKPASYTPIRVVSYGIGAAFLRCLELHSAVDFQAFDDIPFAVKAIDGASPLQRGSRTDPKVNECVKAFTDETNGIIRSALDKNEIVLQGGYPLCSLNIWDARWDGRYATSNYFVSYYDDGQIKVLNGNFVVEMGRDCIIKTVYKQ